MNEAIDSLLERMRSDVDACALGDSIDIEAQYGQNIAEAGSVEFFTAVFRRFEDSTLTGWLLCLAFAWKELSFQQWKQILCGLSDATRSLYGLIPFLTSFLAIDITQLIRTDPSIPLPIRRYSEFRFPRGGPPPGSAWVQEMLAIRGIEVSELWRRMAAQGAPMRQEISLSPRNSGRGQSAGS